MNRSWKLGGSWKPKPISVPVVFRVYAVLFGLAGIMLLIWVPTWSRAWSGQAPLARALGIGSIVAACCAAALSSVSNARRQQRSLFWFAVGHVALWLATLLGWGWVPGLADQAVAILGGTAFVLFFLWLTAEGEFPREPFATGGVFGPPASASVEPLRSHYEQKIRQAAAQEERNRLARDLHDSIKQQIFAIQTAAATAQVRLEGDSGGAREALDQIRSASREAMTEMEVMLDQLRAEPLENTGLVAALKKLCESIGFRTGARVEFKLGAVPAAALSAPGSAEATLRVAQEALANVARHARAAHVLVTLDSSQGRMELTVQDDGSGFDPATDSRGMGTTNMRARAEELGGRLELLSSRQAGTTVKFSIPSVAPASSFSRYKYRNRAITVWLMMLTLFLNLNHSLHHWSLFPAVAFVAAIAVAHYLKAYGRMRRWNQPVL
jgi:signal transduction histidine kinase